MPFFQRFLFQSGTALHETGDTFDFAVARNRDVFAIKKSGTGTHSTEIHILSAATKYQTFSLQTGTALHETGDNFDFVLADNRDLFAIKKSGTGTHSTEVHVLSAAGGYKSFSLQTGTCLHETDNTFEFALAPNRDLFAIKKSGTGTHSTEVHVLSAATGYKSFVLQTGTCLHETDPSFSFIVGFNRDLYAIKKSGTGTHSTEVHVLSAASGYKSFSMHTGTCLHETGDNFAFGLAAWNVDAFIDLVAIKKSATGTHSTEVHIISGRQQERIRVHAKVLTPPSISIADMVTAANDILQPVGMTLDLASTENLPGDWWFTLQTGTCLHETGPTFAFALAWNRDLFAIKQSNTGTHSTEVHILSAASGYRRFALQTGTCLHETGVDFDFVLAPNRDLVAIKKSGTGTKSTEIHILSAASNYQTFVLQTGTCLHETDSTFAFAMATNRDLFAIKKNQTGTKSTEVHVISAKDNYQRFSLQTGTCLHETGDTFAFCLSHQRNLYAIKKSGTGTNSTEVHILSAASGYQAFEFQTGTCLHETDSSFAFAVALNEEIFAFKKSNTGTNSTEVHVMRAVLLNDLDVGSCTRGNTTAEQNLLYTQRKGVGSRDLVVYFVRSTVPPYNGCAAHPSGRPGAVVASGATRWTMIHEIGHVLGLDHVNDNNRLMTGNGTGNITNPPPDLVESEISTMLASDLTVPN